MRQATARSIKREEGWWPPPHTAATTARAAMDAVLREALAPLLRELRQTLASFRARCERPSSGAADGGRGRCRAWPTTWPRSWRCRCAVDGGRPSRGRPSGRRGVRPRCRESGREGFALAAAVAWAGARGRRRSTCAGGRSCTGPACRCCGRRPPTWARWRRPGPVRDHRRHHGHGPAGEEKEQLQAQLRPRPRSCSASRGWTPPGGDLLQAGLQGRDGAHPQGHGLRPAGRDLPKRRPTTIKLDILELDIRPKKVFIRGTVGSAAAVDACRRSSRPSTASRRSPRGRSTRCRVGPRVSA